MTCPTSSRTPAASIRRLTSAVLYAVPSGTPAANGFITPTSTPLRFSALASPAATAVFPTPVSVPATNTESNCNGRGRNTTD